MIVAVTAQNTVELREPDNFKAFKIVHEPSSGDLGTALAGVAKIDADGKTAWVTQDAVRRLGPDSAEWRVSFDKMIESVKKFGWVDDATGTVRAHIETAG